MTFLLVIDHIFYDFPCLYCVKCDITYMALSSREKLTISEKNSFVHDTFFYSVLTFTRMRQRYFSKYWGTDAWTVPTPQIFWGTVPPVQT